MTYYLKYRPQTVKDLDLVTARRELAAILASGRFAHAYLFSGPRGTGKTSAARILAKVVNCVRNSRKALRGKSGLREPCNVCVSCRSISDGSALDLVEIDAASNRGIDDVRELRERIKLAPASSPYKVYIIDEVHMLTSEAFNALLKTLEEPPAHALFILCTTAPEKLPATVISRCTRINFPKAKTEEVVASLTKALRGEKLSVQPGTLEAIANTVDGSFRDGMKILEQLSLRAAPRKRRLTPADVAEVVGLAGEGAARRLLELLASGDVVATFALLSELGARGQSPEHFLREILELLRRLLLREVGVGEEDPVAGLDLPALRQLIRLFSRAAAELPGAVVAELPLELAAAEWLTQRRHEPESAKLPDRQDPKARPQDNPATQSQPSRSTGSEKRAMRISLEKIVAGWPQVLAAVRPQNHSLAGLLRAATPKGVDEDQLVVEVAYPFHKQQLEVVRYRTVVESAIAQVFSVPLRLRYELRAPIADTASRQPEAENLAAVADEALIRAAEEIFGKEE